MIQEAKLSTEKGKTKKIPALGHNMIKTWRHAIQGPMPADFTLDTSGSGNDKSNAPKFGSSNDQGPGEIIFFREL